MADDFFVDKDDKWVDTADDFWAYQGIIMLGVKNAILQGISKKVVSFIIDISSKAAILQSIASTTIVSAVFVLANIKNLIHQVIGQTAVVASQFSLKQVKTAIHQLIATPSSWSIHYLLSIKNAIVQHIGQRANNFKILFGRVVSGIVQHIASLPNNFKRLLIVMSGIVQSISSRASIALHLMLSPKNAIHQFIGTVSSVWVFIKVYSAISHLVGQRPNNFKIALGRIVNGVMQTIGELPNNFKRLFVLTNAISQTIVSLPNNFKRVIASINDAILQLVAQRRNLYISLLTAPKNAIHQLIQGTSTVKLNILGVFNAVMRTAGIWSKFLVEDVVITKIEGGLIVAVAAIIRNIVERTNNTIGIILAGVKNTVSQVISQTRTLILGVAYLAVKNAIHQTIVQPTIVLRSVFFDTVNAIHQTISQTALTIRHMIVQSVKAGIIQSVAGVKTLLYHLGLSVKNAVVQIISPLSWVSAAFVLPIKNTVQQVIAKKFGLSAAAQLFIFARDNILQHLAQRTNVVSRFALSIKSAITDIRVGEWGPIGIHFLAYTKNAILQTVGSFTAVSASFVVSVKNAVIRTISSIGKILTFTFIYPFNTIIQTIASKQSLLLHKIINAFNGIVQVLAKTTSVQVAISIFVFAKDAIVQTLGTTPSLLIESAGKLVIGIYNAVIQTVSSKSWVTAHAFINSISVIYKHISNKVTRLIAEITAWFGLETFTTRTSTYNFVTASVGYHAYSSAKEGHYFVTKVN